MTPEYTSTGEKLLLLLLDDESGLLSRADRLDAVLGAAHLLDLARLGYVTVQAPTRRWGFLVGGTVRVVGTLPGLPVLRSAYDVVAAEEGDSLAVVKRLGRGQRDALLQRLVDRGLVERRRGRFLGLPATVWPAVDGEQERRTRGALTAILVHGYAADASSAGLVALLHGLGLSHAVVERGPVPAATVSARARAIVEGDWETTTSRDACPRSRRPSRWPTAR